MNTHRRLAAIALASTLVVAGCGGGNDQVEVGAPSADAATPSSDAATPSSDVRSSDAVNPTIDPEVPEAYLPGVGPVAVIGDSLPTLPDEDDDPAVGLSAPILVANDFDGVEVRIDAVNDGPTWLIFLAHWCPHCNDEIPVINTLRDEGRIPDGVHVVAVSTAVGPDRPNFPPGEWLQDKDWTYDAIADGIDTKRETFIAADAYGVSGFPFSVLVDADGNVVRRWSGERDPDDIVSMLTNDLALG